MFVHHQVFPVSWPIFQKHDAIFVKHHHALMKHDETFSVFDVALRVLMMLSSFSAFRLTTENEL